MPTVYIGGEAGRAEFDAQLARDAFEQQCRTEVEQGQAAIRDANARLDAVITAAQGIEAFEGTSLTQAQIINTLKQIATGVRLLAEGEKLALADIDYLARLHLRLFDGD